jgi:hypothetical protein
MNFTLRTCIVVVALVVAFSGEAAGNQPAAKPQGRRIQTPTSQTRALRPRLQERPREGVSKPTNTTPASIDGKWWTSGNGFGDSEVVFTQNGSQVSGIIRYADGRTGTVTGTMVGKRLQHTWMNSTGDGGTGWLELSWNNFLGGPWRNKSVRDGSWTLMRVEGKWCFGGSRQRIRTVTHNARGELFMVAEDGSRDGGYLDGPWIYLESDGMRIKGEMDFRSTRVNWSTGFYWTWCGRN